MYPHRIAHRAQAKTKAQVVVDIAGLVGVAVGRTHPPGVVVPGTAANSGGLFLQS